MDKFIRGLSVERLDVGLGLEPCRFWEKWFEADDFERVNMLLGVADKFLLLHRVAEEDRDVARLAAAMLLSSYVEDAVRCYVSRQP